MSEHTSSSAGTLLLIVDNPTEIQSLGKLFTSAGYKVFIAPSAKDAFQAIFKVPPDLIILDINLPDLDGFHVARELKRNIMFRHIPVVLLSNRVDFLEKMRSFDVVVDEYLVRPFDNKDLLLRSQLVLQRVQANLDANPLTHLPGNNAIVKNIKGRIGKGKPFAVGYADLNNFKAYNDKYGFSKGDEIIVLTSKTILAAIQKHSPRDNFVGHIGGDDFIFICEYEPANDVCQAITEAFDKEIPAYYTEEDRKKGYIMVEDRRGIVSQFPMVSVAIGMASDEGNKFQNLGQVNHSLTQLKKYAKSFQGSAFVRDRRTLQTQLAEFTWGPGSSVGSQKVLESIANALGSYLPGQLTEVINKKAISILFQPILHMQDDTVIGHESLVRGPSGTPLEYPDALFQTARTANLVPELDVLCMKQTFFAGRGFRKGMKLFLNVFPETLKNEQLFFGEILHDAVVKELSLVFELSGSNREGDVNDLVSLLLRLRERGQRICVDAATVLTQQGLSKLPLLRPDYIKLNMMHFKDMSNDSLKRDEFFKTIRIIRQVGAEVICTKLESRADAVIALRSGVSLGQGFLFARPAHAETPAPLV